MAIRGGLYAAAFVNRCSPQQALSQGRHLRRDTATAAANNIGSFRRLLPIDHGDTSIGLKSRAIQPFHFNEPARLRLTAAGKSRFLQPPLGTARIDNSRRAVHPDKG